MTTTVLVAGPTGMLGARIANHLLEQPDLAIRLLLRESSLKDPAKARAVDSLVAHGATVVTAT